MSPAYISLHAGQTELRRFPHAFNSTRSGSSLVSNTSRPWRCTWPWSRTGRAQWPARDDLVGPAVVVR